MNKTDKRIAVFIGHYLRTQRRAKDITIDTLASKVGVDRATLNRYEQGKINIPLTKYIRWCRALKVNMGKIINETHHYIFRG